MKQLEKQLEFDFLQGLSPAEVVFLTYGSSVFRNTDGDVEVSLMIRSRFGGIVFGSGPTVDIAAVNALNFRARMEKLEEHNSS